MWKDLREEPVPADYAQRYLGQIQTVVGKVISTWPGKGCISLNFGPDFHTDFTIVIFRNKLDNFSKQGIDPITYYPGKTIKVTGLIKEYDGPQIIVQHPDQIEIVKQKQPSPTGK